jgi:Fe-S cluster biosynthesis and repair protein YggX
MKITKSQLKQIIKEELGGKLTEADIGDPDWEEWRDAHQMLISVARVNPNA